MRGLFRGVSRLYPLLTSCALVGSMTPAPPHSMLVFDGGKRGGHEKSRGQGGAAMSWAGAWQMGSHSMGRCRPWQLGTVDKFLLPSTRGKLSLPTPSPCPSPSPAQQKELLLFSLQIARTPRGCPGPRSGEKRSCLLAGRLIHPLGPSHPPGPWRDQGLTQWSFLLALCYYKPLNTNPYHHSPFSVFFP